MNFFLDIAQIVISLLLVVSILLQARGSGLGVAFGGGDNVVTTRRGAEKVVFTTSICLSLIFIGLATVRMFFV